MWTSQRPEPVSHGGPSLNSKYTVQNAYDYMNENSDYVNKRTLGKSHRYLADQVVWEIKV
jgi:hypothetical protein